MFIGLTKRMLTQCMWYSGYDLRLPVMRSCICIPARTQKLFSSLWVVVCCLLPLNHRHWTVSLSQSQNWHCQLGVVLHDWRVAEFLQGRISKTNSAAPRVIVLRRLWPSLEMVKLWRGLSRKSRSWKNGSNGIFILYLY